MGKGHDIVTRVKTLVADQLDVKPSAVKLDASFSEDLNADSLSWIELVLAFEEVFDVDIPDEDAERIRTVRDAIEYLEEHVAV